MKLSLALIPLLSLGITAVPVADVYDLSTPVTPREDANILEKRDRRCTIVGADVVNCREGFGTPTPIKHKLKRGSTYTFTCWALGERVIVDGNSNASWQWIDSLKCYVNGHYTDSGCTSSALGRCSWD
ncbi:hypothetical protein EDB81DRAFT_894576 [Dactylonectria macrodidyma]|uniref:Uncharacterized protein n=1 Tax=Dactylonectria macrodidyma TaxID=307937 RepID=A0A9P9I901_9HYPO|nr:hypothetical protein EDB81DRAFT_894576 [Dactylonectria macrodidyma]